MHLVISFYRVEQVHESEKTNGSRKMKKWKGKNGLEQQMDRSEGREVEEEESDSSSISNTRVNLFDGNVVNWSDEKKMKKKKRQSQVTYPVSQWKSITCLQLHAKVRWIK